jgi:peptidoglycan hydrolase CwlO-like protein
MAVPARLLEWEEDPVEERIAILETKVDHLQEDVTDLKADVRKLNDKVDRLDERLTQKIEALEGKLTQKIESVKDLVNSLLVHRAFDRVWWLLMSAALLGIMGRAFKWI